MVQQTPKPAIQIFTTKDALDAIDRSREECVGLVADAYRTHARGDSSNPESSFLRIPNRPGSRLISLPAYLGGAFEIAGIKWISSFPSNSEVGLPRAAAALILNDIDTGYPYAVLEASTISATRTAASAVLAAELFIGSRRVRQVGIIGTGVIASHVWRFLQDLSWEIPRVCLFDLSPSSALRFRTFLEGEGAVGVNIASSAAEVFQGSDLILITTVASEPHLDDPELLDGNPVVLHLSLRDLGPSMILAAQNFTDDQDHALRENTSLDLTQRREGRSDFIAGTIADLLVGKVVADHDKPRIFSPFGLGVLDLAIAKMVFDKTVAKDAGIFIPDFF